MNKEEFKKEIIEKCGYSVDFVLDILENVDNEKDIKVFADKIEFLNKNGVSEDILDTILAENPLFLTTDLETVKASVNFLKNIKIDDIPGLLDISPEILSTSDKVMSENYKLLKILIPEKELRTILKIDAEILTFNTDYLEKRLEFFINNDLKDQIKNIILHNIEDFEDEEDEIDIERLKKFYK